MFGSHTIERLPNALGPTSESPYTNPMILPSLINFAISFFVIFFALYSLINSSKSFDY